MRATTQAPSPAVAKQGRVAATRGEPVSPSPAEPASRGSAGSGQP